MFYILSPIFQLPVEEIDKIFSYRYPVVLLMMILAVYYLNYVLPNIKLKKRVIWPKWRNWRGIVKDGLDKQSFLHTTDPEMTRGDLLLADHPFFVVLLR